MLVPHREHTPEPHGGGGPSGFAVSEPASGSCARSCLTSCASRMRLLRTMQGCGGSSEIAPCPQLQAATGYPATRHERVTLLHSLGKSRKASSGPYPREIRLCNGANKGWGIALQSNQCQPKHFSGSTRFG